MSLSIIMNKNQALLLELIRLSQFGCDDKPVYLGECDEEQLFEEAQHQRVLGLIATVLPADISDECNKKISVARNQQLVSYIRYLHAQQNLTELLRNARIPFAVLKGLAAGIYYKDISARAMGDIDFIVPQEYFESTKDLMLSNGYELYREVLDGARNIAFIKNEIHFELHHHFSADDRDVDRYIINDFDDVKIISVDNTEFPMLPPLSNGIVLLDHIKDHLKTGLGLRQIIDWMMYVDRELHDDFWDKEFKAIAEEVKLKKLAIVTTKMCQKYLGLTKENITWCFDAEDTICDELIENLLASGNFGRRNGAGNNIETVSAAIEREGLFKRLQRVGEINWTAYKKHKWLKPFCWIYQAFRYLKQGITSKRSGKQLKADVKRAKKKNQLLKDLEII